MAKIYFTIPLIPKAQMRDRIGTVVGHAHSFKDTKQRVSESHIMAAILPYKPATPILNPVELRVMAFLPIPKSKPKWWKEAANGGGISPSTKPDLDNLVKQIKDCLTAAGFWHDDSQVVNLIASKMYSVSPKWKIEIKEIENMTVDEWKEICGG